MTNCSPINKPNCLLASGLCQHCKYLLWSFCWHSGFSHPAQCPEHWLTGFLSRSFSFLPNPAILIMCPLDSLLVFLSCSPLLSLLTCPGSVYWPCLVHYFTPCFGLFQMSLAILSLISTIKPSLNHTLERSCPYFIEHWRPQDVRIVKAM